MFKALPSGTLLAGAPEHVIAVWRAQGPCTLALGSGAPRQTTAWVVNMCSPDGQHRVYAYLQVVDGSDFGGLLFRADPEVVPPMRVALVQEEALDMVAGQGFSMIAMPWGSLPASERLDVLQQLPFPAALTSRPVYHPPPGLKEQASAGALTIEADAFEISTEISLPRDEVVRRLGTLLALF
jgi:hypothetical protein